MVSSGKSESSNASMSNGMNQSYIQKDQLAALKNLWGTASNDILNNDLGAANNNAQGGFLQGMQNNPFMQGVNQARDYQANAQQQIKALNTSLTDQFTNVLMPGINDASQQGGALGGGRQGVAQGIAAQGTQQAMGQGASSLLANAFNQSNQAQQFGAQQYQNQMQGGIQGLGQIQQQQYAPLMALAQILGNPAILQRGITSSMGTGSASSENFGFLTS